MIPDPAARPTAIGRREALALMAGGIGVLALSGCVTPLSPGVDPYPGVTAVGQAYLERRPEEASRSWLLAHLGNPPATIEPPDLLRQLASLVLADVASFPDLRVIHIDGWLVSETVGRVAALWVKRSDDD